MKIGVGDGYHDLVVDFEDGDTEQLRRIVKYELREVVDHFGRKNGQYGENAFELGIRGQFSDIHRKYALLKRGMWDAPDAELEFESLAEVLTDVIGHCLLALDLLHAERS